MLRGNSFELRRLKPDPLNLSVNTGVGKRKMMTKMLAKLSRHLFYYKAKISRQPALIFLRKAFKISNLFYSKKAG
jgi:hypothetical protein